MIEKKEEGSEQSEPFFYFGLYRKSFDFFSIFKQISLKKLNKLIKAC